VPCAKSQRVILHIVSQGSGVVGPPTFAGGFLGGIMGWGGWRDKAVSPPFGVVSDTNSLSK